VGKKVYIETYGCWLNRGESEVAKTILREKGYEIVSTPGSADIVVVNTCAVRGDTERNMLMRLEELKKIAPQARFIVTGCLVNVRPKSILEILPDASLLEPDAVTKIGDVLEEDKPVYILRKYERDLSLLPKYREGPTYVIPIQSGCTGSCSFCVEWVARGRRVKSYPVRLIVDAVKEAVSKGAKEVYLTGQDVASYGLDIGTSLPKLLETLLEEVPGNYRVRIGMMEPSMLSKIVEELVPLFKDPRLYKYFHIPVQHGDDRVLSLMNRKYTVGEYKSLVERVREGVGLSSLVTDIIVGFPGETEEAFQSTLKLLEEIMFDKVHVARYTLRPFTKGYLLPGVPEPVKKRRSRLASELALRISGEVNRKYEGKLTEVLVNGTSFRGDAAGRTPEYKLVIMKGYELRAGDFVKVRITKSTPLHLEGEVVD
jgi:MiaB/RimO family radical SAM methylthiotransferase